MCEPFGPHVAVPLACLTACDSSGLDQALIRPPNPAWADATPGHEQRVTLVPTERRTPRHPEPRLRKTAAYGSIDLTPSIASAHRTFNVSLLDMGPISWGPASPVGLVGAGLAVPKAPRSAPQLCHMVLG